MTKLFAGALMGNNRKRQRYLDFLSRVRYAPESAYQHLTQEWLYIPIHPFGDELDLLNELGIKPTDCWSVDAWWGVHGDATLVQVWSVGDNTEQTPGLYAFPYKDRLALHALIDAPFVTRALFEAVLSRFAELSFPAKAFYTSFPKKGIRNLGVLKYPSDPI